MAKNITSKTDRKIVQNSIKEAFIKLHPRIMFRNPVMFVTWIGASIATVDLLSNAFLGIVSSFEIQVVFWLWITVVFANFAEAMAEGRSRAQAESLKQGQKDLYARLLKNDVEQRILASKLAIGDVVVCEAGDIIPVDGEVIEGIASVDESAITGESAPVIRESGGDRSAVTGGTKVISDRLVIRITTEVGHTFIDRIISLIENAKRQKTPNEIALTIVLTALSLILLLAVSTIKFFADYSAVLADDTNENTLSILELVSLLVCLIPTTIGGLLSAIGIAGMDRLIKKNVIAKSGRAIEAAGDIDLLLIDKTGTITLGNRVAVGFFVDDKTKEMELAEFAQLASLADETPEGRSIVVLAKEKFNLRALTLHPKDAHFIPFSAQTRISGVDLLDSFGNVRSSIRKGAVDAIVKLAAHPLSTELKQKTEVICQEGGTPLAVVVDKNIKGIVHLKDMVKGGIKERFLELRKMDIKTIMITGDNTMTAAAIAAEAGVDDFIAEATPESKLWRIREEQRRGKLIAMTGDGTNDAPALAQADVGVAMNTGTQAAREAGNMVDLDSSPTKVIDIVKTGRQLLMTRGSLTTFSIANDIAKYFALLPAMFMGLYHEHESSPLSVINVMSLHSSDSAILSAVIFNALIIVFLIPLALKGVTYQPQSTAFTLKKNLTIYGVSGLLSPFLGIKIIDEAIVLLGFLP